MFVCYDAPGFAEGKFVFALTKRPSIDYALGIQIPKLRR